MNDAIMAQQRLMQAVQNYQMGDLAQAEKDLKDLCDKFPKSDQVQSILGVVLYAQGKLKESFRAFKEAIDVNPMNPDAVINIASVELARNKVDAALKLGQDAVKKFPTRADAHFNLGNIYNQVEKTYEAKASYEKAVQLDAQIVQAHVNLAYVNGQLGLNDEAEANLKKALELKPDLEEAHINLGHMASARGDYDLAEEHFKKAGDSKEAASGLSQVYSERGKIEEAEEVLENTLGLDENDVNSLVLFAEALVNQGKREKAETYFKKALALEPEHKAASQGLRKLLSIKIPMWHFYMLADTARNDAYDLILKKYVKPDSLVLDIGAGSGLLSMMAARAGAQKVIGCELHKDLAETAAQVVEKNGYANQVQILSKKSTDLKVGEDLPEKADIVVSEILDSGGIGEGVLPTMRHALKHLVKENARVIPAGISLYGQLIEIPARYLVNPVRNISGFDLSPFDQFRVPDIYVNIYLKDEKYKALSEVFPLRAYDFNNIPEPIESNNPEIVPQEVSITDSGTVQAVVFWFDLHMDEEVSLSSGPGGEMVHWGQAIYYLEDTREVKTNEKVSLKVKYSDWMLRFEL